MGARACGRVLDYKGRLLTILKLKHVIKLQITPIEKQISSQLSVYKGGPSSLTATRSATRPSDFWAACHFRSQLTETYRHLTPALLESSSDCSVHSPSVAVCNIPPLTVIESYIKLPLSFFLFNIIRLWFIKDSLLWTGEKWKENVLRSSLFGLLCCRGIRSFFGKFYFLLSRLKCFRRFWLSSLNEQTNGN